MNLDPVQIRAWRLAQTSVILAGNGPANQSGPRSHEACEREIHELREACCDITLCETLAPKGGGGEHLIFRTEPPDGLIYKATWREQFGLVPAWNAKDDLELRPASPSEYLLRCGLANAVFGDDIQLWAIVPDQAGNSGIPSIVTTQPFIVGRPSTQREITAHLKALGFVNLPHRTSQVSGLHDVWCRPADQVMVCDAVAGNFVTPLPPRCKCPAIDLPASLLAV